MGQRPMPSAREAYLNFGVSIARSTRSAILPHFRTNPNVDNKLGESGFDPVTEADRAAEALIREEIARAYPEHGVLGEEFGESEGDGHTWVIDPIDGTRAFMTGMVHWGVLLGLRVHGEPSLGVMYQPFTDETWFGDGETAWYSQAGSEPQRLTVRGGVGLSGAVLGTTSPGFLTSDQEKAAFAELEGSVQLCRYGGDCYVYAMLASGFFDLAVDGGLNVYDILPLIPIIRGAGGVVGCWDGSDPAEGGNVIAAGDAALFEAARAILAPK